MSDRKPSTNKPPSKKPSSKKLPPSDPKHEAWFQSMMNTSIWEEPEKTQEIKPAPEPKRAVSGHKDPTADIAIANVMREEKRNAKNAQNMQTAQKKEITEMRESDIEKAFVEAIRAAGGQALKLTSQTMNGLPDRLVLLFPGKTAFVELKAPGKQMRLLQRKRRKQLEALGFPVFCIDRMEQIAPAVEALKAWSPGEPFPSGIGAKIPDMPVVSLSDGLSLQEPEIHEKVVYGGKVIGGVIGDGEVIDNSSVVEWAESFATEISADDDTFTVSDDSGGGDA